jgi:hypothetical protein
MGIAEDAALAAAELRDRGQPGLQTSAHARFVSRLDWEDTLTALLVISVAVLGSDSGDGRSRWEYPLPIALEDDQRMPARQSERRDPRPGPVERDLWCGTPRAMPGGDLLRPILALVRRPSRLLDFRPRSVLWAAPSIEDPDLRRTVRQ